MARSTTPRERSAEYPHRASSSTSTPSSTPSRSKPQRQSTRKVVTLSGHRHVVVAIEADLRGTAGHVHGQRGEARPLRRLGLLAAEGTAHPPALAHHRGPRHPEHVGDEVLHLRRMLGRGPDPHLVVLSWNRERRLPLEVEVLLAADAHPAFDPVRRVPDRGRRLTASELVGSEHFRAVGQPILHRDAGRHRLDFDAGAAGRPPGGVARVGDHREGHLAVKENLARGEDRIVAERGAAVVRSRDVRGGQHRQHPGAGTHRVEVDRADDAARGSGATRSDVHGAGGLGAGRRCRRRCPERGARRCRGQGRDRRSRLRRDSADRRASRL